MRRQFVIAIILSVFIIAGCSPAASEAVAPLSEPAFAPEAEDAAGGFATEEVRSEGPAASFTDTDVAAQQQRLVIYNANLVLVVDDPAESLDSISDLATNMGGFVVSSNLYESSYRVGESYVPVDEANITIRVPAEQLQSALEQLKRMAVEVDSESLSGQDVTSEYTDLASRLRNLETAEAQLQEIMDGATKTEDVLAVYNELVRVQEQIEVIRGQMQYFEESARLSAINIQLLPNVDDAPIDTGGWKPLVVVKNAIESLLEGLQFLGNVVIYGVICGLPLALLFGAPGFFGVRAIRRRRARGREQEPVDREQ